MDKSKSKYFNTAVRFNKALLSLLEKKTFEYITISEVCEKAQVNRSTFYLHYENLCDLLEETTRYALDNFVSYFSVDDKSITSKFQDCDLDDLNFINEKYLHPYLSYIKEQQNVFSAMLSQPVAFNFEAIFKRLFDNIFNPILNRFDYPEDERKYVMIFYLSGINAIITEWLKDGCQKSIDEISLIIHSCIFGKDGKIIL